MRYSMRGIIFEVAVIVGVNELDKQPRTFVLTILFAHQAVRKMDTSNMSTTGIRQKVIDICYGQVGDAELFRQLADFLVCNKDSLPASARTTLWNAFGRRTPANGGSVRKKGDALERIMSVKEINLPELSAAAVELFKNDPSLFWRFGVRVDNDSGLQNPLSDLYLRRKKSDTATSISSAFHSIAVFEMIQMLMKLFGTQTFTRQVATYCANMIAREDYSGVKNQRIQDIIHDLELDYAKGNIYSRYTSAHGYGIIFYMFVVPSTLYEKFLKSKSDVDIVISHFLNVGLSIGDNATLAGKRIVESVTSRFKEQALTIVNICGTLSIDPCSSKRKRARSQTSTIHAARKDPGGSTRTEPQIEQIQHRNASGTPGSSEVSNIAGTIETHTYKNTSSQTTLSEPYGIQQVPGSANIVTGDTPVSSLISPTEQEAQPTLFMSPGTIRQPHSAAQRVSGTVQHTTSPFNIDSVNAAHLMQNFNITSFANAAELMENFDVTSFDPLTAASLMQSFDLFHPMPDIRYHDNQTYN